MTISTGLDRCLRPERHTVFSSHFAVQRPLPLPDIDLWAVQALMTEVMLTPKPGLVDQADSGAHRDMDLALFQQSIRVIAPWLRRFTEAGYRDAEVTPGRLLMRARPIGIACEQAMLTETQGINTHKGGIFAFGLLCMAAGWLAGRGQRLTQFALCETVATMCQGLVQHDLSQSGKAATAGEQLFQRYGLTGARGEAESGFRTVRAYALPAYRQARRAGATEETALLQTLLVLMAHNQDTNLVSRGGMSGLAWVQDAARAHLRGPLDRTALVKMNHAMVERNLSPGGSADLLAVTWLLFHYPPY